MAPELSDRGLKMPASPIRSLVPYAVEARKRGIEVLHLNIGQPDLDTPEEIRERLTAIDDKCLQYSPATGTDEFLATMQRYYARYDIELALTQMIATTGASEAILFALMACCDQGDDVLVVEPFYANYRSFARMGGIGIAAVTSRGRDGFHLPDRHVWERELTPETRAVLICNPNNPTGAVYGREELEMVAEFCRDHDLFLISDEVYREFAFDGRTPMSALELEGMEDYVIVADSLSKRYSSCGIRLGCYVTRNEKLYLAAARMAQARLAPPGLAQMVAVGIGEIEESYLPTVRDEYQRRRDFLYEALTAIPGVFLRKPEGAFYFIARLPVEDCEDFAKWLLAEYQLDGKTVMVAPAKAFYDHPSLGHDEVRIAYVLRREDLAVAVRILETGLAEYRKVRGLGPIEDSEAAAS